MTDFAALIVTLQAPVPAHAPDQPLKAEPLSAAAVSVTAAPLLYNSAQSVPQAMPVGLLVTVPPPVPAFVTVKEYCFSVKVAVTDFAALIVTLHVPVLFAHAPDHPANVDSAAGVAVKVTTVLLL